MGAVHRSFTLRRGGGDRLFSYVANPLVTVDDAAICSGDSAFLHASDDSGGTLQLE